MEESAKHEDGVQVIETKLDSLAAKVDELSTSVDDRFNVVDRRFDELEAAIVENRRYTEFGFAQLDHKIDAASRGRTTASPAWSGSWISSSTCR
jgi:hypothetical protein